MPTRALSQKELQEWRDSRLKDCRDNQIEEGIAIEAWQAVDRWLPFLQPQIPEAVLKAARAAQGSAASTIINPLTGIRSEWEAQSPADLDGLWKILGNPAASALQASEWREKLYSSRQGLAAVPADKDLPVWSQRQRLSVAGAIAAAGGSPAFLSFRLAGIQDFIDRSRTTADYWSASSLLAHVAWAAARPIVDSLGPDSLVFPRLEMTRAGRSYMGLKGGETSFPSGFLAIVPKGKNGAELAGQASRCLDEAWRNLSDTALEVFKKSTGIQHNSRDAVKSLWSRQTEPASVFEIYWTLEPWGDDPAEFDYLRAFRRISAAMEARKTLRSFAPMMEPGLKCHQDGIREALPGGDIEAKRATAIWKSFCAANWAPMPDGQRVVIQNRFRESERLSAVAVIKRLSGRLLFEGLEGDKISFPSSLSVAVVPFLERLVDRKERAGEALNAFLASFESLAAKLKQKPLAVSPYPANLAKDLGEKMAAMDGSWWYEATYRPAKLKSEFGEIDEEAKVVELAEAAIRHLRLLREKTGLKEPSRYLTVLCADTDHVGRWIAGSHQLRWIDCTAGPIQAAEGLQARRADLFGHIALTESLSRASEAAVRAIEALGGRVVYAGGDDLLAFCPAGRTCRALDEMARQYEWGAGWREKGITNPSRLTLSASALIVPANNPLTSSVQEASRLLHDVAKEKQNRAAAAVGVLRQSGQETVASAHWTSLDQKRRIWADLQSLVEHFRSGTISPRGVAKVGHLRQGLGSLRPEDARRAAGPMLRHLFGVEPDRPGHGEVGVLLDTLAESAADNAQDMLRRGYSAADGASPWLLLEAQLLLARFVTRHEEAG